MMMTLILMMTCDAVDIKESNIYVPNSPCKEIKKIRNSAKGNKDNLEGACRKFRILYSIKF